MAKADKKFSSGIEGMKAMQRQLQRADDAGLFDGMKAWAKAWHETHDADDTTSPPPVERIKVPHPPRKRWMRKEEKLLPIERAKLMIADRKLFPDGCADMTIAAVHHVLAKQWKPHGLKKWGRDTTARALKTA